MIKTKEIVLSHGEWQERRVVEVSLTDIAVSLPPHNHPDSNNPQKLARRTITLCPTGELNDQGIEIWRMPSPEKLK